jgi:hypothetical protein
LGRKGLTDVCGDIGIDVWEEEISSGRCLGRGGLTLFKYGHHVNIQKGEEEQVDVLEKEGSTLLSVFIR